MLPSSDAQTVSGTVGWYTGLIDIGSVGDMKAGTSMTQQATVFQWKNAKAKPTVKTANITGLASITGGPYATQAVAKAAANGTGSTGLPGEGKPAAPSTSTVNSADGHLPSVPDPLTALMDFLSGLESANLWIRVAKVAVGGTLILIAVSKITGAGSVISKLPVPIPV